MNYSGMRAQTFVFVHLFEDLSVQFKYEVCCQADWNVLTRPPWKCGDVTWKLTGNKYLADLYILV